MLHHELYRAAEAAESRRIVGEGEDPGDRHELRLHLADHILHRAIPLVPVGEAGEDDAAVHPPAESDDAEVRFDVFRPGEDAFHLALVAVGVTHGRAFRRDDDGGEEPAVVGRDELALERAEDEHRRDDRERRRSRGHPPVRHGAAERARVPARHRIEAALQRAVDPPVARRDAQNLGAEHRRQRERDDAGEEHRARHRDAELVEQASRRPLQEGERGEDRDERERRGDDGEADLARAVRRRRLGVLAQLFLVAVGVLEDDDRVVHHDADGEREREQREVVDREAEEVHDRERPDDAGGDREAGDDRGAEVPQEEEDDEDDEPGGDEQRLLGVADGALHEHRPIEADVDVHAGWQRTLDHRQLGAHYVGHLNQVGLRLAHDTNGDRGRSLEAQDAALVLGAELHARDVAQLHRLPVAARDGEVRELVCRLQLAERADGELAPLGLDAASRDLDIAGADRGLDVLHREPARAQLGGGEPDAHREAPLPDDLCAPHAGHRLQARLDETVGDVRELEEVVVVAGEREVEERLGVGVLLGDHRLEDLLRQPPAHARHLVAHVLRDGLDVAVEVELERDVAELLGAGGGERAEPGHGVELLLQDVRDRRLHDARIGAAEKGGDGDDGRIDVRKLADGELRVTDRAEEHERGAHHDGEHRAADGEIGDLHAFTMDDVRRGERAVSGRRGS